VRKRREGNPVIEGTKIREGSHRFLKGTDLEPAESATLC